MKPVIRLRRIGPVGPMMSREMSRPTLNPFCGMVNLQKIKSRALRRCDFLRRYYDAGCVETRVMLTVCPPSRFAIRYSTTDK
jgi:hypothetical protein